MSLLIRLAVVILSVLTTLAIVFAMFSKKTGILLSGAGGFLLVFIISLFTLPIREALTSGIIYGFVVSVIILLPAFIIYIRTRN